MGGLEADNLVVTKELDLTGTTFTGPVRLLDAEITGQLIMRGAQLTQAGKDGRILSADGLKVGGSVFLDSDADRGAFAAAGAVRLAVTAGGEADSNGSGLLSPGS
jgi:hypothetical protein